MEIAVLPVTQLKAFQPRYRLGRITNKYLIIDIFAYAYLTREEAIYRLFKQDKSSRILVIELFKRMPYLIPHQLQTLKLDYSRSNKQNLQCAAEPSTFIITKTNHLNNHLKLDIVINAEFNNCFKVVADILAQRHLIINEERYGFIKDTLTINFDRASDEKINGLNLMRLNSMQQSHRINIILNISDHEQFKIQDYIQELDMKQIDVTVFVTNPSNQYYNHDPLEVRNLKIIASQIVEPSKKNYFQQFFEIIEELIDQFPSHETLSIRHEISISQEGWDHYGKQVEDKLQEFHSQFKNNERSHAEMTVKKFGKEKNGKYYNILIIQEGFSSEKDTTKSGPKKIIQNQIEPLVVKIDCEQDLYTQLYNSLNSQFQTSDKITIDFNSYVQPQTKVLDQQQIEVIKDRLRNSVFKNLAFRTAEKFYEKYQIPYVLEILKMVGTNLTCIELSARDSSPNQARKWKIFLNQCNDLSSLIKIKFNSVFSDLDIQQMQKVFMEPKLFPNLISLQFTNVEFTFKSKNDLISFLMKDQFRSPLSVMPNISQIQMKKNTNQEAVEQFCKNQAQCCTIHFEMNNPKNEVQLLQKMTLQHPLIRFVVQQPNCDDFNYLLKYQDK